MGKSEPDPEQGEAAYINQLFMTLQASSASLQKLVRNKNKGIVLAGAAQIEMVQDFRARLNSIIELVSDYRRRHSPDMPEMFLKPPFMLTIPSTKTLIRKEAVTNGVPTYIVVNAILNGVMVQVWMGKSAGRRGPISPTISALLREHGNKVQHGYAGIIKKTASEFRKYNNTGM